MITDVKKFAPFAVVLLILLGVGFLVISPKKSGSSPSIPSSLPSSATTAEPPALHVGVSGARQRQRVTGLPMKVPQAAPLAAPLTMSMRMGATFVVPVSVTNLAALSGTPVGNINDGTTIQVMTVRSPFTIETTAAFSPDGITVIASTSPGRVWIRQAYFDTFWTSQASWNIDPANTSTHASDENSGATSLLPLLTYAEAYRRLFGAGSNQSIGQNTTVTWLSYTPTPTNDTISIDANIQGGVLVTFNAAPPTRVFGGAFTSVAGINRAANTAQAVTDTTITNTQWSNAVGDRIRITSGARAGAQSWVAKGLGANNARTAAFVNAGFAAPPQMGDPYQVETLQGAAIASVRITSKVDSFNLPEVDFNNFDFSQSADWSNGYEDLSNAIVDFNGCNVAFLGTFAGNGFAEANTSGFENPSVLNCLNCLINQINANAGTIGLLGGVVLNTFGVQVGSTGSLTLYGDVLFQGGGGVIVSGRGAIVQNISGANAGFFDSAADALHASSGGTIIYNSGAFYGAGNAGAGVDIFPSSNLFINSSSSGLTVTGTGGDFKMDNSASNIQAWDVTLNAGVGGLTAARTPTWANYNTTVAGGGFGGHAVQTLTGARIDNNF